MTLRRHMVVFALILSSASLTGCAISNPYIDISLPARSESESIAIGSGIEYAQNVQAAYRKKLAEHARIGTDGGAALTLLGSAVLGLATFDAHIDSIIGAALAGGTGYALGKWYANENHELIYIRGMEAINCAIDAVLPLNFSAYTRNLLKGDLEQIRDHLVKLRGSVDEVQRLIPLVQATMQGGDNETASLINTAQMAVAQAIAVVNHVDEAATTGGILLYKVDGAGEHLITAVNRINVAVDQALQQSNPRLESLSNVISTLSASTGFFAPGVDLEGTLSAALTPEKADERSETTARTEGGVQLLQEPSLTPTDKLKQELGMLQVQSDFVSSLSQNLNMVVKGVSDARPLEALKACNVDTDSLPTKLSLSKRNVIFEASKAMEQTIIISGGKKPYVARFLKSPTPGLRLRNPMPISNDLDIIAGSDVTAGQYDVLVSDAAQNRVTFTVQVH